MQWENLTAEDLEKAVTETQGVCLLPLGVLEKHGSHLPLGTDAIMPHEIGVRAAEVEPAVVFPAYYFGSIHEARHQPGAIDLPSKLIFELLSAVCDEIARNGFKKILIVNGHGGNRGLLEFFQRDLLRKRRDYMLYVNHTGIVGEDPALESTAPWRGHADEAESAIMMYLRPELVKDNGVPGAYGYNHARLKKFSEAGLSTPVDWYAGFPGTLCGDRTPGSADKGESVIRHSVEKVIRQLRLIKADDTPRKLYDDYHDRAQAPVCNNEE